MYFSAYCWTGLANALAAEIAEENERAKKGEVFLREIFAGDEPAAEKYQDRMATIDAAYRRVMKRRELGNSHAWKVQITDSGQVQVVARRGK